MDEKNEKVLGIFAIYDKKGERYDTPFFAHNELFAKRRFILMMDEKGPLTKWPEDFRLEKIGVFDIFNGLLLENKKIIIEAASIIKKEKEVEK